MWKNFGSAIVLLAVALVCALYSSSVARDGRMIAAGVSAILALGIALWVAVRFVPRLASSVEWNWMPFLTQYHVTREGWIYLGGLTVVLFAAINTNNNLLYMVLSALIAVLLLSGISSGMNFKYLQIELRVPPTAYAGEAFPISLQIRNRKKLTPSFSLSIESIDETGFLFQPFFIACVRGSAQAFRAGDAMLRYRGHYRIRKLKLYSRYPFGFFLKAREYPVSAECICYPEILPQYDMDFSSADVLGSSPRYERGVGTDLHRIRDYLPVDGARHVHWKASAKTGALKTREFAAEESRRFVIHLDRFAPVDQTAEFERLVSYAASIAVYLVRDGIDVAVLTDEWASGFGCNDSHLQNVLHYLALVKRSDGAGKPPPHDGDSAMVLSLRQSTTPEATIAALKL
jgi:uncharacterized protein (DUF58 family)